MAGWPGAIDQAPRKTGELGRVDELGSIDLSPKFLASSERSHPRWLSSLDSLNAQPG
jgi:hypothetical protein